MHTYIIHGTYSHIALPSSDVFASVKTQECMYTLKLYVYVCFCCRKTPGTIDVIGGGTATISRVEGRRRHNLEGNNIQVTHMTCPHALLSLHTVKLHIWELNHVTLTLVGDLGTFHL